MIDFLTIYCLFFWSLVYYIIVDICQYFIPTLSRLSLLVTIYASLCGIEWIHTTANHCPGFSIVIDYVLMCMSVFMALSIFKVRSCRVCRFLLAGWLKPSKVTSSFPQENCKITIIAKYPALNVQLKHCWIIPIVEQFLLLDILQYIPDFLVKRNFHRKVLNEMCVFNFLYLSSFHYLIMS